MGDLDEDGDVDIMLGSVAAGSGKRLYLNNGNGVFVDSAERVPNDSAALSVALGDVDRDGDLDLVVGNGYIYGAQNALYPNFPRQLEAPRPPRIGQDYLLVFYAMPGYAKILQGSLPLLNLTEMKPRTFIPPFGFLGLSVVGLLILPPVVLSHPEGRVSQELRIPNLAALRGHILSTQALMMHATIPHTWRFTNLTRDRIQ
jgi:hypothetical protein